MVGKGIVYCGNSLSDSDLSSMSADTIKMKLGKRSTRRIMPGSVVPYMVVFSDFNLDALEDYSIEEVKSSSRGK